MSAVPKSDHVDVEAALNFLRLVTPPGVHMNLVAFDPATDKYAGAFAFTRETISKTSQFIQRHTHHNQYWSVNPLKTALNTKASKAHVAGMLWAHCDRDNPAEAALSVINSVAPPPTLTVFSGGGYQAFWRLKELVPIVGYVAEDKEAKIAAQLGNVPILEETNCGVLVKSGEADEGTRNIDRIMRLVGTTNWPTKSKLEKNPNRVPVMARLIEHHPERVYALEELPKAAPKTAAPTLDNARRIDKSKVLFHHVRKAVFDGATDDQIHADCATDPHVLSQSPGRRKGTIDRCIGKARAAMAMNDDAVAAMNEKHAVLWVGNHMYFMWRNEWNGLMPRLAGRADMKAYYSNATTEGGNPFDLWMHWPERAETTIVFEPGGLVTPGAFNLWRGFGVEPQAGDCSLFLNMVRDVICSGDLALYRYVIAWCADAAQNPSRRPGVVLVLKGPPGTGKGTFAQAIGRLFGEHFVYVSRAKHVTGNFNAHVANRLLMFADEAVFAGDKPNEGALKSMITEPQLPVELKGKDVIYTRNHLRIIMASNQDWVVPAAIGDRRFAIIEVSALRMQDIKYFKAVHEQMSSGGDAALLHHLLTFNLDGIELRDLPRTDARLHQQLLSMAPIEKWWFGRLQSGAPTGYRDRWADEVLKAEMVDDYLRESGIAGTRHRGNSTEFGIALVGLVPGLRQSRMVVRNIVDQRTGKMSNGTRANTYLLPPLAECREAFAKRLGGNVVWPEEGGADRDVGREM
jgi:hypothetical protein